ncbi:hypothetical protein [Demequina sp. NBRC 110057]|uniref:hypothetical protein n=1 Tax=Demequina sp. NBRC 110057 TaxID=1570346 RepID=UPI0011776D28|nr:hypothetical protein [Demequina sp. NBRC 110057]
MSRMAWRLFADGVVGVTGLVMLFWALETVFLVSAEAARDSAEPSLALTTYLMLFFGLILGAAAMYDALRQWSIHLRHHPRESQAPAWLLTIVIVLGAAALLVGLVIHTAYVADLATVPTRPSQGYVLYQVTAALFMLVPLVPLSVRWAPGYRRATLR